MELSELLAGDSDVDMMARLSSDTLTLFFLILYHKFSKFGVCMFCVQEQSFVESMKMKRRKILLMGVYIMQAMYIRF